MRFATEEAPSHGGFGGWRSDNRRWRVDASPAVEHQQLAQSRTVYAISMVQEVTQAPQHRSLHEPRLRASSSRRASSSVMSAGQPWAAATAASRADPCSPDPRISARIRTITFGPSKSRPWEGVVSRAPASRPRRRTLFLGMRRRPSVIAPIEADRWALDAGDVLGGLEVGGRLGRTTSCTWRWTRVVRAGCLGTQRICPAAVRAPCLCGRIRAQYILSIRILGFATPPCLCGDEPVPERCTAMDSATTPRARG